jgi:DNA-binding transcriptional ArsR family regulator
MSPDRLSTSLAALADPTRRAILARLALGETSVTELAEPFEMSLPAVSKHLKVVERAGLIARGREAQWRPCRIEFAALKDVDDWLEAYRRLWDARLDRLDDYRQGEVTWTQEITPAPGRTRGRLSPPACSTRRANSSLKRGPIKTPGAMVGAERLHYHHSRDRRAAWRRLAVRHARPRRRRL